MVMEDTRRILRLKLNVATTRAVMSSYYESNLNGIASDKLNPFLVRWILLNAILPLESKVVRDTDLR